MAILHSIQSGNFTDSSTWGLVDPTSALISTVSSVGLTPTYVQSASFIPGAINVQGVSIYINSTAVSASLITAGTVTIQLYNVTTSSITSTVTLNASDLPNSGGVSSGLNSGWTFFKFTIPVTLVAGNSYAIRALSTSNALISIWRDATTNNISRALVTTTTQAPASTDTLIISGEHTGVGVNSIYEVMMNSVSNTTSYGTLFVSCRGTLNYGTSPYTTYKLKIAGDLYVTSLGVLQIGSDTTPMPDTSTASLEISCASLGQYTIYVYGGTFTTYGASMPNFRAKLNADVAIGNTTSTTDIETGWKSGYKILVPSTTTTASQYETITLTADAVGTTLTHTPYVYAHGGNANTMVQADIGNITNRNITIFSTSPIFKAGIKVISSTTANLPVKSTFSLYWTSVYDFGVSTVNTGASIYATGADMIFNMRYCTLYATNSTNQNAGLITNITISSVDVSDNIFYTIYARPTGSSITPFGIYGGGNNNLFIANTGFTIIGYLGSNNVIASSTAHALGGAFVDGSSGNSIYANSGIAWYLLNWSSGFSTSNNKIWRNGLGIVPNNYLVAAPAKETSMICNNFYMFGNGGYAVTAGNRTTTRLIFNDSYFWGGTGIVTQIGVDGGVNSGNQSLQMIDSVYFNNCTFGKDYLGNVSNFSTACVRAETAQYVYFYNCTFSGTEALLAPGGNPTNNNYGYISYNHNGVTGSHKLWANNGIQSTDNTVYSSGDKSLRITPSSTTVKNYSPNVRVPVKAGDTCTVSVKVRESTSLDGTIYNGTTPRLMYVYNPVSGNLTETVGSYPINIFEFPQDFNNAYWAKSGVSIIPNTTLTTAPDGTYTADICSEIVGSGRHRILLSGRIVPTIGTYNMSIYVKKKEQKWIQLNIVYEAFSLSDWANFDVENGVVGNTGVGAIANIEDAGNGWWRCSLVCNCVSSTLSYIGTILTIGDINGGRYPSYAATGVESFYIWGNQFTQGPDLKPYYGNGTWETLTYTAPPVLDDSVLEFYVDCDGTTGWINVDDWSTTTFNDTRGYDFSSTLGSYVEADYKKPGGSYGFIQ